MGKKEYPKGTCQHGIEKGTPAPHVRGILEKIRGTGAEKKRNIGQWQKDAEAFKKMGYQWSAQAKGWIPKGSDWATAKVIKAHTDPATVKDLAIKRIVKGK